MGWNVSYEPKLVNGRTGLLVGGGGASLAILTLACWVIRNVYTAGQTTTLIHSQIAQAAKDMTRVEAVATAAAVKAASVEVRQERIEAKLDAMARQLGNIERKLP